VDEGIAASAALVLETLLFRSTPPPAPTAFAEGWGRVGVVTADPSMEEPYRRLVRFAPQPVTVLVLGESGSGKEAVARAVHSLSPRASAPFVAVNIAAIPAALLESELFGHARGAFTGAERDRPGLLEEASRGTIFFDEIGDLPLSLQAKLLRALQEREIRRVGENRPRPIDARVVSATSRDLEQEVEAGRFREDLFYRIHVAVIQLPALARRGKDVGLLARHFLSRYAREYGRGSLAFSPEAFAALAAHSWPGNVREVQNAVAQAAALADAGGRVTPEHLPEALRREKRPAAPADNYRSSVDAHRRGLIAEALDHAGGNRSRAARELGLSRQALLYLIRELNVPARPRSGH
jgi:transcriptional regulator with PAS, ATPase and Fis domain